MASEIRSDFDVYSLGICYASVCSAHDVEKTTELLNQQVPTGIDSKWTLCEEKFVTGEENPCQCPDREGNKHYLFNC